MAEDGSGVVITGVPHAECLGRAEAYVLSTGGSIKQRTDTSVRTTRFVMPSFREWIAMTVITLISFGLGIILVIVRVALMVLYPAEARLMAHPMTDGRTRLVVVGKHAGYREELENWVRVEFEAPPAKRRQWTPPPDDRTSSDPSKDHKVPQ